MSTILRQYIRTFLSESKDDIIEIDEIENDVSKVEEFSGVGAIAGFTAPLGWSGKDVEGPGTRERKKRKKPAWK
jgi:hypothetical protein